MKRLQSFNDVKFTSKEYPRIADKLTELYKKLITIDKICNTKLDIIKSYIEKRLNNLDKIFPDKYKTVMFLTLYHRFFYDVRLKVILYSNGEIDVDVNLQTTYSANNRYIEFSDYEKLYRELISLKTLLMQTHEPIKIEDEIEFI